MTLKTNLISIVIPVFNGEKTIAELVDQLVLRLQALYPIEIVLVNDCSPDRSEDVCVALFQKYPDTVKYFSLAKNVGEHNAVIAGLHQTRGDYVVIMDDDFQNPIGEACRLIDFALSHDYDVVYTYYRKKRHSLFRNLGSMAHQIVAKIMLQKPKGLYLSSFKCLNRFIVDVIIQYDLPFPYIDGLILRTTEKIGQFEVEHHLRLAGKSGYTLKKLLALWLNSFTNFSILPLRISMVLGLLFSCFGLFFGVDTILEKIANPHIPIGYASIIVILSMFSGVVLVSLGIIGEYVGRIYLSQNRKPQFTIRKRFVKTADTGNHEQK